MSSLYSIGQMNEIADAFEEDGFTADHLKVMISGGRLTAIRNYLDGDADIVPKAKTTKPVEKPAPFLRLISGEQRLTIPACSGKRTIVKAKATFTWEIDGDFKNWGLDIAGPATPDTDVEVHEMIKDGTFADIYSSTGHDLDRLVLTQDQIISFVETHKRWLRTKGYAIFFLLKQDKEFFVAGVCVYPGALYVDVTLLSDDSVWLAEYRRRFVFPQLTPGA